MDQVEPQKLKRVTFREYVPNQTLLFPPSLSDFIDANHPVRVVDEVVERIDITPLLEKYKGGGASSYHPRMLLKVLIFAYLNNIYSSRRIEAAVKENVYMMWLSGMQRPDHNTINRFRSQRLKGIIKQIFGSVVQLLIEAGHVDLKDVYTDGTKIEANANRYTFVWRKAITRSKERIAKQLEELWNYAEGVAAEEMKDKRPESFEPVSRAQVLATIEQIDQALGASKKKRPKRSLKK